MSSLDMALDDIVKKNRPRVSRSSPPVGKGKQLAHNKPKSNPHTQTSTGPVRHQKRNTAPKTPYQKSFVVPSPFVSQSSFIPPVVGGVQLAFAPSHAAKWTHDLYQGGADKSKVEPTPAPVKKIQGDTVHVSNLAPDVTDDDVKEIFQEIGPVKSCTVNYNASGQSTGTATVVFVRKADAERAVAEFDEAEVDGRVMKLLLVGSVVTAPVVVKKSKPQVVQAAPQPQPIAFIPQPIQFQQQFQQPKQQQQQFRQPKVQQQQQQKKPQPQQQQPQRGGKVQRGGRGGSAPSRGVRPQKTPATAEDLDKEMEHYHTAAAPPSAAAAGQPVSV